MVYILQSPWYISSSELSPPAINSAIVYFLGWDLRIYSCFYFFTSCSTYSNVKTIGAIKEVLPE